MEIRFSTQSNSGQITPLDLASMVNTLSNKLKDAGCPLDVKVMITYCNAEPDAVSDKMTRISIDFLAFFPSNNENLTFKYRNFRAIDFSCSNITLD